MVAWCHVQATCWNLLAVLRCLEAIPSRFQKQDLKWYDYFHVFFTRDFQFVKINVFKWLRKKQNLGCIPIPWEKVLGGLPWLARLNLDGIDQRSTSPKSGCFFLVGFFFHFVAMTDQPVLFGAFVHIFDQRTGQDQLHDLSNTLPVPGRRHNLSIVFLAMVSQEAKTGEIFTK